MPLGTPGDRKRSRASLNGGSDAWQSRATTRRPPGVWLPRNQKGSSSSDGKGPRATGMGSRNEWNGAFLPRSANIIGKRKQRISQHRRRSGHEPPGFLRRSTVSKVTQQRYNNAFELFKLWVRKPLPHQLDLDLWDQLLTDYIECLYFAGESPAAARYTIYGISCVMDFTSRAPAVLPLAKRSLRGFLKKSPEGMRDPPPMEVMWLLCGWLLDACPGPVGCLASAFVLLVFDSYLRPTEALYLLKEHVYKPKRGTHNRTWSLVIYPFGGRPAKNQQWDTGVTVGAHNRHWATLVLAALWNRCGQRRRLFDGITLSQLEDLFRK